MGVPLYEIISVFQMTVFVRDEIHDKTILNAAAKERFKLVMALPPVLYTEVEKEGKARELSRVSRAALQFGYRFCSVGRVHGGIDYGGGRRRALVFDSTLAPRR